MKEKKQKNKETKAKKRFQPHFRKFHDKKTTGHPQYVFDENGRKYRVIGITSSPKTNGIINVQLEVNPEPGNTEPAFVRPNPDEIDKGTRNEKLKGWKLSGNDKQKVKKIIEESDNKKARKKSGK